MSWATLDHLNSDLIAVQLFFSSSLEQLNAVGQHNLITPDRPQDITQIHFPLIIFYFVK